MPALNKKSSVAPLRERHTPELSENVLQDPYYFGRNPTSDREAVWVPNTSKEIGFYARMGYQLVRPEEVETLDAGRHQPREKDFGLRYIGDTTSDRVIGPDNTALMWIHTEARADLLQGMADRSNRQAADQGKWRDPSGRGRVGLEESTAVETL